MRSRRTALRVAEYRLRRGVVSRDEQTRVLARCGRGSGASEPHHEDGKVWWASKLRGGYMDGWLSVEGEVMKTYIGDFNFPKTT